MDKILHEKDAINIYNKYYNGSDKNIKEALIKMEVDGIIPYFFMNYYSTYLEFLNMFNIPKSIYLELKCPLWIDKNIVRQNILRQNIVIKDNIVNRDIIRN